MFRTYAVTYQVIGNEKKFYTKCTTSLAYNTSFADIPKMIATKRGLKPEQIEITYLELLSAVEQNGPTVVNIDGPNFGAIQM